MSSDGDWPRIVERITDRQVLALEQAGHPHLRHDLRGGPALADHRATCLAEVGLDVEMMDVTQPAKPGQTTRQPMGRLRGAGAGRASSPTGTVTARVGR